MARRSKPSPQAKAQPVDKTLPPARHVEVGSRPCTSCDCVLVTGPPPALEDCDCRCHESSRQWYAFFDRIPDRSAAGR